MLQPQKTVQSERCNSFLREKPDYLTLQTVKTEIVQRPSQLLSPAMLFQPSSLPLQRGHLYVRVIPQTTPPMNMLQGKHQATSTWKMLPARVGAGKTTLWFPKFQHQRTEWGKGLAYGTPQSISPRTHSCKETLISFLE